MRSRTGTSACAATSTKAIRTGCRAPTSTRCSSCVPLPYAEAGYGNPESGQTVINVTDGKLIRLLVDDEPFDVRYGMLDAHERTLDLRAGTLSRRVRWTSPAQDRVRISSVRLVSLTHRAVAAICYEIEPIDTPLRIVVQSELVANEALPAQGRDPRTAAVLENPLVIEEQTVRQPRRAHGAPDPSQWAARGVGHGARHRRPRRDDRRRVEFARRVSADRRHSARARSTVAARQVPGLRLVESTPRPALQAQVVAALAAARMTGWDGLVAEQRRYLDEFWAGADVEVVGDPEVQQAVRFSLFHILQSAARAEQRPIPAKGLTGNGYDGHTFWDTETFVLPVLMTPCRPLPPIRCAGGDSRSQPRRSEPPSWVCPGPPSRGAPSGAGVSGYWPAGTASFHINADIANAVVRYLDATGDGDFEREVAVELLVQTARLWRGLGHHDHDGRFRIDGVTGPDEYSAVADNNVYTNLMAQQNLRSAADIAARHGERAEQLGVTADELHAWREAADAMTIPYDERLGVHPQSEGFTDHAVWDFAGVPPDHYPLFLHYPYLDLYRKQVVKQADLVLAMHLQGHAFTPEQKERNFRYYEALTVRDSSLSACTQSVMAAEVGHLELAHDYLARGRAHRPRRARAQHRGRAAPRLPGRSLDRPRRRLRRDASTRWATQLRPPCPQRHRPAGVPCPLPWTLHQRHRRARSRDVSTRQRDAHRDRPPRRRLRAGRRADPTLDPECGRAHPTNPTNRSRATPARHHQVTAARPPGDRLVAAGIRRSVAGRLGRWRRGQGPSRRRRTSAGQPNGRSRARLGAGSVPLERRPSSR